MDHENIENPVKKILEGIKEFNSAAENRIHNKGLWNAGHLSELNDLRKKFMDLQVELIEII